MGRVAYDFSGKTVVVTGASRGIGYAVAKGFARSGAKVYVLASGTGIHDAATDLSQFGDVTGLQADITDSQAVADAMSNINQIDILVNNAGLERITPLEDPDPAVEQTFARIIDINVNGTFLVTRHAAAKMEQGGRIILTASIWSRTAVPEFSAYVASKHANLGFMRSIAHELGPRGINVNAVCPGWVKTDAAMLSLAKMSETTGRTEENLLDEITGAQVLGGLLEPDDMAPLYMFLASDGARDITGQAYMLDRGEVMA
ncbi:MAG: SDR family oxidoreductase [Rhodobacteraceae bacterium]|nr:SDR family oxidoreductase [Paracoccaceae bacterium]